MASRKSEKPMDGDMLPIRNSTAEFLTFVRDNGADTIAVREMNCHRRQLLQIMQLFA